jgi:serine protease AprX
MEHRQSNHEISRQSANWGVLPRLLLAAALLIPALSAAPRADAASKVQPDLMAMATRHPDASVSVIVQKLVKDRSVETMVGQLGGTVTKDLHIINAFGATMSGKAVTQLGKADGVRWISPDAPVVKGSAWSAINPANLRSVYQQAVGASRLWTEAPANLQGNGVTIAVIDSGLTPNNDLGNRVIEDVGPGGEGDHTQDGYGHGTFVMGVLAGNGRLSNGAYVGIAPAANIINYRVSDSQGLCTESDIVESLQWVNDHKSRYNIRVVNMSLNSAVQEAYNTSAMDAAAEVLWFNGITVVVSAGNNGTSSLFAPANDPFVITVGATNDMGTAPLLDDAVASFSAYGTDETGHAKPDLVAPGTNVVAVMPGDSTIRNAHPANRVDSNYFRMSGTSMAAPMVSGAAALLLQDEPNLTPDQVKYRLKATAVNNLLLWPAYSAAKAGAGYLDVYAAVHGTTTASANTGLAASHLLWTGSQPLTWGSVNWNSVNWNSVNWNSVNWNSVNWNSVNWNSDYWGP